MADEKIQQILEDSSNDGRLFALTNSGRILHLHMNEMATDWIWSSIELPELNKPKPRAQAKESAYSEEFLHFWSIYPRGHGGSKKEAYRQWCARLTEDSKLYDYMMINGAGRYAEYIKATGQHVKHPATFLGRDKHYLNDFTIPESAKRQNRVKQDWEKIPENDNHLAGFIEQYGFKQGHDRMDKVFDTRKKLQAQIKQRIEDELN